MKAPKNRYVIFCLAAVIFLFWTHSSADIAVVTDVRDSVSGSLRFVLSAISEGDTVIFDIPGQDTIVVRDTLVVDKSVVISGTRNAATNNRIVVGIDSTLGISYPVFLINRGRVHIKGIVIKGEIVAQKGSVLSVDSVSIHNSAPNGNGISSQADSLVVRASVITGNGGVGLRNNKGNLTIVSCEIGENRGGGIYIEAYDYAGKIDNCVIRDNARDFGAGLTSFCTLYLSNTFISNNAAFSFGAGIVNSGVMRISDCIIDSNSASDGNGGGIWNSGIMTIENSRIHHNSVKGSAESKSWGEECSGGGIYNEGQMAIKNCTVDSNLSYASGKSNGFGGTSSGGGIFNKAVMTIVGSTISGNSSEASGSNSYGGQSYGGGIYNQNGSILTIINCTIYGNSSMGRRGGSYGGTSAGGGIYNMSLRFVIAFSTIGKNSSTHSNGDPFTGSSDADDFYDSGSTIINSIIYREYVNASNAPCRGINVFTVTGLPNHSVNSLAHTSDFELFGSLPFELGDNGGTTKTVAIDSLSIARGSGIKIGMYEKDSTFNFDSCKIIKVAYFDGVNWLAAENDSVLPPSIQIVQVTTDQRGVIRPEVPGRGAYEFSGPMSAKKGTISSRCLYRDLQADFMSNRLRITVPGDGVYHMQLFSMQGRIIIDKTVDCKRGVNRFGFDSRLSNGTYLLQVTGMNSQYITKVFKR